MSPASPKPYHPGKQDPPEPFDIEKHQEDNLRDGGRRDALWEFLTAKEFPYIYTWGNNPKRKSMKGQRCKIIASGKMNSIQIEFENGQRECVSRWSVRRTRHERKCAN